MRRFLLFSTVAARFLAFGQTPTEQSLCRELNEFAVAKTVANHLDQAEAAISSAVSNVDSLCAGAVLANVAALLSFQGRVHESEAVAERSIGLIRKNVGPDDPRLLRPLHALAIARLDQGQFGKAEQAFKQMLQVRAERPEERGQIHITGGVLRQLQRKFKEAETEYLLAYEDWKQFGKPGDADEAAILNYLGAVYIAEARFKEAAQVLDRALAMSGVVDEIFPVSRIKLLNERAAVHARQGEWPEAEAKLRLALAIADSAGVPEGVLMKSVLDAYAIALRKNHRRREARVIESRVSALPRDARGAVIDVRELSKGLSSSK
jgi:tetratricopeptide (TPR) repeat protein